MKQITEAEYNQLVDGLTNYNVSVVDTEHGKSTAIQISRKKIAFKSAIGQGQYVYFDTRVSMSKRVK